MRLKVELADWAYLPMRATKDSAGLDLCVYSPEHRTLVSGEWVMVRTGVKVAIPRGYVGLVVIRSGLSTSLQLMNAVGVIDADYRGEIMLPLVCAVEEYTLKRGDRIAQLVIVPAFMGKVDVVNSLSPTKRGEGGFGSTGK